MLLNIENNSVFISILILRLTPITKENIAASYVAYIIIYGCYFDISQMSWQILKRLERIKLILENFICLEAAAKTLEICISYWENSEQPSHYVLAAKQN